MLAAWLFTGAAPAAVSSDEATQDVDPAHGQAGTRTIVAGKEFDRSGAWRYWFGDGYRKAWTTPVELPVLDLTTEAGGLTPLRQVGGSRRKAWP